MIKKSYKLPLNHRLLNKYVSLNVYKNDRNKTLLMRGGDKLTERKIELLTNHKVRYVFVKMTRLEFEKFKNNME